MAPGVTKLLSKRWKATNPDLKIVGVTLCQSQDSCSTSDFPNLESSQVAKQNGINACSRNSHIIVDDVWVTENAWLNFECVCADLETGRQSWLPQRTTLRVNKFLQ